MISQDENELWKYFPAGLIKRQMQNNYLFIFSSHFSFVGALHRFAFESLQIGKSPSSYVYENTSFQEPAVNLYLVQAA